MRTGNVVLASAIVLLVGSGLEAQVPPQDAIHCLGTESGGGGLRQYQYDVFNGEPVAALTSLFVGTDDINPANYGNWLMPAGWTVAIQTEGAHIWKNTGLKTPHGQVAPPPGENELTFGWIHWWSVGGQAIQPGQMASFGFDNDNPSQNVDWFTTPQGAIPAGANWNSPVGTGTWGIWTDGPVHSPVPEPTSLSLLALGGLALLRRRR